ncbi:tetratricopeptide repeat protein [Histidinibacterium aquaticum]|uniref:Tetratricopeptide repeat protein n=1 Tax=Histidinibacterium aquaticum TaxID=2613962 RepID=A0A5J5GRH7_9RHOB|nr:tetratricopeptide repeat protein [Histidinibacterium aquaticum]KAA9009972.1 hypothetical protein F3S47_01530 [Histidinibacterium aquaticum]
MSVSLRAILAGLLSVSAATAASGDVSDMGYSLEARETADFLKDRRQLLEEMLAADPESPEERRALLDLASFYLAHVMVPEGLSALDGIDREALGVGERARFDRLRMQLRLVVEGAAPPQGMEVGGAGALWTAIAAIRRGESRAAAPVLQRAYFDLSSYPRQIEEALLLDLFAATIANAQWQLAGTMASQIETIGALRSTPRFEYLMGQVSEQSGDLVAAFDRYERASRGETADAHLARLALVRMGRSTETLSPEEGLDLLDVMQGLWKGGEPERATLRMLAQAQVEANRTVDAIETYARIRDRFPGTEAAAEARQLSGTLIRDWYELGAEEELGLAEFFAGHRRIAARYRFEPSFSESAELFAERLVRGGVTGAAADEYRALREHMTAAGELDLFDVDAVTLDRLLLNEAEALMRGGRFSEAESVLSGGLLSGDPDLRARFGTMSAEVLSETGGTERLVAMERDSRSPGVLRILARAHYQSGDWDAARSGYLELWDADGDLAQSDAIELMLAAHRLGDAATVERVAGAFPELEATKILAGINEDAPRPPGTPLRRQHAVDALESADRMLQQVTGETRDDEGT